MPKLPDSIGDISRTKAIFRNKLTTTLQIFLLCLLNYKVIFESIGGLDNKILKGNLKSLNGLRKKVVGYVHAKIAHR